MYFNIPFPENEINRLRSLLSYDVLDTLPEKELDAISQLASFICQTPISLITLLDKERQWFKSRVGFDLPEIDRNLSFCQKTIMGSDFYEIPDLLKDPEFKESPLVNGQGDMRYYGGCPLTTPDGFNIGTICVLDRIPRSLTPDQRNALSTLAKAVIAQFELRKKNNSLQNEINVLVQEKIREKEIDLEAYKYALDETSIILITNPEGEILRANDKQCQISGYANSELLGNNSSLLNSGFHSKEYFRTMWDNIKNGKTWKGEFKNKNKHGKTFWVHSTIIPFRNQDNITYQYVAIQQDITERKIREERIRVYEDIVKNMKAGIYVFTPDNGSEPPDFTLTASNLAAFKITGINGNRMLGKKMSQLFPNLMNTDIPEKLSQITKGAESLFIGEFPYDTGSGNMEYFSLNAFSLPNSSIAVSFDNITARKQVESELIKAKAVAEQSVITKDNFLANMSHEIRTPMNAIIGFTDVLINTQLTSTQRESVMAVKSAGENLLEIINDILDFSKIESGKLHIENRAFNLKDTLTKVIALLKVKAEEKGIRLNFNLDTNLPEIISGDKMRLNQIIINLVGNAIKFTAKGDVSVNVKCKEDHGNKCTVKFSVKDTGIGIPADMIDNIFDRFVQASSSTSRKFGGTGLGLSIVKNLIELQGGTIKVNSIEREGSEFTFCITYDKVDTNHAANNRSDPKKELKMDRKTRVLLFEDNPLNQKLATIVLKGFGIDTNVAENGKVGVKLLENNNYDLILMDLQMPEMDGYEATRVIRQQLKLTIPIMAMTAHSLIGEKEKCIQSGMDDYITKPFKQEELFTKINTLLQDSRSKEVKEQPEKKLVQLAYLQELCGGDAAFEKEILNLFMTQVPVDMQLLADAIISNDFLQIGALSHKLKSSVAIAGLSELPQLFLQLEQNANQLKNIEMIKTTFDSINKDMHTVYQEIKEILQTA